MLVPLEKYPYFISQVGCVWGKLTYFLRWQAVANVLRFLALAQISSVMYCFVYFPLLWWQSKQQKASITQPLRRFWKYFMLMGFLDGLGDTLGLVGARHISGALLTLLPKVKCTAVSRQVRGADRQGHYVLAGHHSYDHGGFVLYPPRNVHSQADRRGCNCTRRRRVCTRANRAGFTCRQH